MPINRVIRAIEEIKKGNMVVMIDDEDRENEGDLVYAATFSTPEKVNFMASYAKGLICVTLEKDVADRLQLTPMVANNDSQYTTAFTISVDAASCHTGISAYERDDTIKILANPISQPNELVRPGHIFPLIAKDGGVLVRTGHTEGSVDLCKLAGLNGVSVICEIMREDGQMARRDDLEEFAKKHNLTTIYISDLVEYRLKNESLIKIKNEEEILFFNQQVKKYTISDHHEHNHVAILFKQPSKESFVKFHNISSDVELLTNYQKYENLIKSINFLAENGGILIFLDSKSDVKDKIKEFGIGAQILRYFNIENIKLLISGNKRDFVGICGFGLNILDEIKL